MNPRRLFITAALFLFIGGTSPLHAQEDKKAETLPKSRKQETAAAPRENPAPRANHEAKKETRLYTIPRTFTVPRIDAGKANADPFSEKSKEAGSGAQQTLRITFLKAGVELNTDDEVSYDEAAELLTATTSVSAHRQLEDYFAALENEAEKQIHILVEFIEVDHLDFSDWMLENRISGDGTPLRMEVQKWAREGKATILESVMVSARTGQRAKVESIHELIYPTEYEGTQIPDTLTQDRGAEIPTTGIVGTAYETRNVGVTLEVDPVIGSDNTTIDLNLAPELVRLDGWSAWPNDDVEAKLKANMPNFYTMKTTTQVTTLDGRYAFISTMRPLEPGSPERKDALVLLFVRADIGSMGEWSVKEAP